MDYQEEKKFKKNKLTRKDFKQDVKEATMEANLETDKKQKPKQKAPSKGKYSDWKVSELRRHVNEKKRALLTKAGFPNGQVPRSKAQLITLCRRLKRKLW